MLKANKGKKSSGFQLNEALANDEASHQFIPYNSQFDDNTISLSDGEFLRVIKLSGISNKGVSNNKYNLLNEKYNLVVRAIADPKVTIWHNVIKKEVNNTVNFKHKSTYQSSFFNSYQNEINNKKLLVVEHYFTIIVKNPNNLTLNILEKLSLLFSNKENPNAHFINKSKLDLLDSTVNKLLSGLSEYRPRLLGVYNSDGFAISEVQSFLFYLINHFDKEVVLTDRVIKSSLPVTRIFFNKTFGTLTHHTSKRKYFNSLSVKEYSCRNTSSDAFDDVINLPFEFILTQTFEFQTRDDSIDELEKKQRGLANSDDRGFSDIQDLFDAMDEVATMKSVFGLSTLNLVIFADDQKALKSNLVLADSAFSKPNIITVRDDLALEAKWWSILPGNFKYRTRVSRISSLNFCDFSSMKNDIAPSFGNERWGEAMFVAVTDSLKPYPFDLHFGQRANTTVVGETGSGKTVLMVMIALSMSKYGGRYIYFDKDLGAQIAIKAIGDPYIEIVPGEPTGFNPLQLEDTPSNRAFLERFIGRLVKVKNIELTAKEKIIISDVVKGCFEFEKNLRVLRYLAGFFPSGDDSELLERFSIWINDGRNAWLFDNEINELNFNDFTGIGFDLTHLLDDEEIRDPALAYMTHLVKQSVDGSPWSVIIDEGWKALDDELFKSDVKNWAKVIRKEEGFLLFGSNSARDLCNSEVGKEVINQSVNKFFGYNPDALVEDYVDGFSLSLDELELVRRLKPFQFLVKKPDYTNIITIPFKNIESDLKIISGTKANVLNMKRLISEDSENWIHNLKENS